MLRMLCTDACCCLAQRAATAAIAMPSEASQCHSPCKLVSEELVWGQTRVSLFAPPFLSLLT